MILLTISVELYFNLHMIVSTVQLEQSTLAEVRPSVATKIKLQHRIIGYFLALITFDVLHFVLFVLLREFGNRVELLASFMVVHPWLAFRLLTLYLRGLRNGDTSDSSLDTSETHRKTTTDFGGVTNPLSGASDVYRLGA